MNSKANIMYFIDHLCSEALKERHVNFPNMVERDIHRIVNLVAPVDGSGATNVKVVKKVFHQVYTHEKAFAV